MAAYYNEFDPHAAAWLRELIKRGLIADGEVDERSILDVSADELRGFTQCHFFAGIGGWSYALRLAGWPDERPVWTGSPPCQPFSAAGKQLGRDDARHLAPHFISLVGSARPPVLFGEQVASSAVFGKPAKPPKRGDRSAPEWAWIDDLSDRLEAAHYAIGTADIPAAGVGAPHIRQRTFFGAIRMGDTRRPTGTWDARNVPRAQAEERSERIKINGNEFDRSKYASAGLGRLADADRTGPHASAQRGIHSSEESAGSRHGEPERPSADGWLADTQREQREERLSGSGQGFGEKGGGAPKQLAGLCMPDGLADADRRKRHGIANGEGCQHYGEKAGWLERNSKPERGRAGGGMADAPFIGRNEGRECGTSQGGDGAFGNDGDASGQSATDTPDSPWRDADLLFCRDAKWRPVEPSLQRLVDGIPAELVRSGTYVPATSPLAPKNKDSRRVQRLKGYGNAIVPSAAAHFISIFLESINDEM